MTKSIAKYKASFDVDGVVVIPSVLGEEVIGNLRIELLAALREDQVNFPEVFDFGMVHNCMLRGREMRRLLDNKTMNDFVARVLTPTFILYAYQSSSLLPGQGNYGSRMHVDSPRFIQSYITNVGVIFPLDDFTLENGATYYMPGSHLKEARPPEENFLQTARRCICSKGDMIVFSGRLWHSAGVNKSSSPRHSLTINFCRSYMRQRFDFPRMVASDLERELSDNTKKLLGWNVRVPTSLEEFYLPESERLYKPNQG